MAHATDIVGYTFDADLYCPAHIIRYTRPSTGTSAEERLEQAADQEGVNRADESTFDSSEFPKVVFRSMLNDTIGENDLCGDCGQRLADASTGTDLLPGVES